MTVLEISCGLDRPTATRGRTAGSAKRGLGIEIKLYAIVALLAAVTVAATALGVSGMRDYHAQVAVLTQASDRALLGEQLDKLVTATVMDSRGIYMAADRAEAEKYAPPLLRSLEGLRAKTTAWLALAPAQDRGSFEDAAQRIGEFIGFRAELVRLAREVGVSQARAFGDNDANRANRSELNKNLTRLVEQDSINVASLNRGLDEFYARRLQMLLVLCAIGIAAGGGLSILFFRYGVAKPLSDMIRAVSAVAAGNLQVQVPALNRGDEIGLLGRALSTFKDELSSQRIRDQDAEELRASAERAGKKALLEMCEMLEGDLESAVAEVLLLSKEASQAGEQVANDGHAIAGEALVVASSAEQASGNVTSVLAATEELATAGREIAMRAAQSSELTRKAVVEVERAGTTVSALSAAADQIRSVVNLISEVAAQTNLLALNATIEAARAGEAGRGFSVVATEVKALARKTSDAATDINQRISHITSASFESVEVLTAIGSAVRAINEANSGVAAAAEEQDATLREIARSLSEASVGVGAVASGVGGISRRAERVQVQSRGAATSVARTDDRIGNLRANLVASLRLSAAGDRRASEVRIPVSIATQLRFSGEVVRGSIVDISVGGALFRPQQPNSAIAEGATVTLDLEAIGVITSEVLARSEAGIHLQFSGVSAESQKRLLVFIKSVEQADSKFIAAATAASQQIAAAFERAVAQGAISREDLFNGDYLPIPDTNPAQFETRSVALCDQVLPAIIEPVLGLDPRVVFCAAVDRNGYLPTHNRVYSKPQRKADPDWNAANCRNRRIFNDRNGLAAARTTRDYLLQTYDRDMGNGTQVSLKEVDVPIRVGNRHWGAVRLSYKA